MTTARRTLEEIEESWEANTDEWCDDFPVLLAIAQGQREEIERLHNDIEAARDVISRIDRCSTCTLRLNCTREEKGEDSTCYGWVFDEEIRDRHQKVSA